jgi:outer membrane autotransporter protein
MIDNSKRNPLVSCKNKVMSLAAFTFFLCLAPIQAQVNISDSNIYNSFSNNVTTAVNLATTSSGTGNLDVLYPSSTSVELNHDVNGYIHINNQFDLFEVSGTKTLTGINTAALSVTGGTNLFISGASFAGGTETIFSNAWNEAYGGQISGTATSTISGATFTGGTLFIEDLSTGGPPPVPGQTNTVPVTLQRPIARGSDGLYVDDSHLLLIESPTFVGGNGIEADSNRRNADATGGNGLTLLNSSAVISNGTFQGGNGGTVDISGSHTGYAQGGHGLYTTNSTLVIHGGSFSGGFGGSVNGNTSENGSGLIALGESSITNYGATFSGKNGSAAVQLQNSDFTSLGGAYTSGGLLSSTTGIRTNTLNLLSGSFDALTFESDSTNGQHYVTESNIVFSGQTYQNGGTVVIDNITDSAFQNLEITSGSMIFSNDLNLAGSLNLNTTDSHAFFQGLDVGSNATVNVGTGTIMAEGTLLLQSDSTLKIQIKDGQVGTVSATGSATFETNAVVVVDASEAGFSSGTSTNTFLTASVITGFNTNDIVTEVQVTTTPDVEGRTSFGGFLLDPTDTTLAAIFNTASLSEYWDATGTLAELANELETLASSEMNSIINNLGSSSSKSAIQETYLTTMNTFQVAQQGLDAAVGLSTSRGTEFRDQLRLPKGAGGPPVKTESEWRFWAKYYGQFYHRDQDGLNQEYDANMHGGVLGMDKNFGHLLVGISGGAGRYSIDTATEASEDMDAYQLALYSTIGKNYSYLDAGLAYGFNDVESVTAEPFVLNGEFDTQLISAHFGGGYGFEFPGIGTVITPEAAIRYTAYEQEAYTESSTTAVPRSFNAFDADSLLGTIGLNAAMLNAPVFSTFAFKLEGRAHYLKEFNPEPGDISYQLVGGANDYLIAYPSLDENTIRLGFGFTFFNTGERSKKNIMLRLDFDELLGKDFNSANLSAKAIFAF